MANIDRILPVVGTAFNEKKIMAFNPDLTGPLVDIAYRCGIQGIFLERGHPLGYSLPYFTPSAFDSAFGWADKMDTHFEEEFRICDVFSHEDEVPVAVDLIVGGGSSRQVYRALSSAMFSGTPAIVGFLTAGHIVSFYYDGKDNERARKFIQVLKKTKSVRNYTKETLRTGELLDCMGWMMKTHFLKDEEELRNHWTWDRMINQKRSLVVRGHAHNPYEIFWNDVMYTGDLDTIPVFTTLDPELTSKHIMVIGCGTATLFLRDAVRFFKKLTLIDYKPFSEFNPVRQDVPERLVNKRVKSIELVEQLYRRIGGDWETLAERTDMLAIADENGRQFTGLVQQPSTEADMQRLLDEHNPDLVILSTGRTQDVNHALGKVLRQRSIPHIIPSALPGALYHKLVIVPAGAEKEVPCYSCFQGKGREDRRGPDLPTEARELYYGGTQPATMFETLPSARALLRTSIDLISRPAMRSKWFAGVLSRQELCHLHSNVVQRDPATDEPLYGLARTGKMMTYSVEEMAGHPACPVCGRLNGAEGFEEDLCVYCKQKPKMEGSMYCGKGHEMLALMEKKRREKELSVEGGQEGLF